MSKSKTELVVKSNCLIEASYRLNLVEQQIILLSICRCRETQNRLSSDTQITITASDFADYFKVDEKSVYAQLKTAMDTLYTRSLTIHDKDPDTGFNRVTETRWISDKSYVAGTGKIQFTFGRVVIPYITRLGDDGGFTSYRLEKIGGMSSTHAVRLYELLVQYLSIGKREIEIVWLKELLQITNEYPRLESFKRRVIDLAVAQINERSDIKVSYTQRKTGRAVTHLIFDIKVKPEPKKAKAAKQYVAPAGGSDARALPGESQYAFNRRTMGGAVSV